MMTKLRLGWVYGNQNLAKETSQQTHNYFGGYMQIASKFTLCFVFGNNGFIGLALDTLQRKEVG